MEKTHAYPELQKIYNKFRNTIRQNTGNKKYNPTTKKGVILNAKVKSTKLKQAIDLMTPEIQKIADLQYDVLINTKKNILKQEDLDELNEIKLADIPIEFRLMDELEKLDELTGVSAGGGSVSGLKLDKDLEIIKPKTTKKVKETRFNMNIGDMLNKVATEQGLTHEQKNEVRKRIGKLSTDERIALTENDIKGYGDIVKGIENLEKVKKTDETEYHLTGYNYMGKGTNIRERIMDFENNPQKAIPINSADYLAALHDIVYQATDDPQLRLRADKEMLDNLLDIYKRSDAMNDIALTTTVHTLFGIKNIATPEDLEYKGDENLINKIKETQENYKNWLESIGYKFTGESDYLEEIPPTNIGDQGNTYNKLATSFAEMSNYQRPLEEEKHDTGEEDVKTEIETETEFGGGEEKKDDGNGDVFDEEGDNLLQGDPNTPIFTGGLGPQLNIVGDDVIRNKTRKNNTREQEIINVEMVLNNTEYVDRFNTLVQINDANDRIQYAKSKIVVCNPDILGTGEDWKFANPLISQKQLNNHYKQKSKTLNRIRKVSKSKKNILVLPNQAVVSKSNDTLPKKELNIFVLNNETQPFKSSIQVGIFNNNNKYHSIYSELR